MAGIGAFVWVGIGAAMAVLAAIDLARYRRFTPAVKARLLVAVIFLVVWIWREQT